MLLCGLLRVLVPSRNGTSLAVVYFGTSLVFSICSPPPPPPRATGSDRCVCASVLTTASVTVNGQVVSANGHSSFHRLPSADTSSVLCSIVAVHGHIVLVKQLTPSAAVPRLSSPPLRLAPLWTPVSSRHCLVLVSSRLGVFRPSIHPTAFRLPPPLSVSLPVVFFARPPPFARVANRLVVVEVAGAALE